MEDGFLHTKGVTQTTVGYCGGKAPNPNYRSVCSGSTGHAETVEVVFDPTVISYRQLLDVFFSLHDPSLDRAEYNGGQYRSVIFYHSPEQQKEARAKIAELQDCGRYRAPITTEVVPEQKFWRAEDYHQKYYQKHHSGAACAR